MNSYYNRNTKRKWTWVSPNTKIKNGIDYIISNKPKLFSNIDIVNQINNNTDHRMLRGQLYLRIRRITEPKTSRRNLTRNLMKLKVNLPLPDNILHSINCNLKERIRRREEGDK